MKTVFDIAEALRDAATAGGDVYSWEFDSTSLSIESMEISRGRVSDITLESDIDITHVDGERLRDVVIVNKEVFDMALESLDKLTTGPDPELVARIDRMAIELDQLAQLVKKGGANNG